MSRPFAKFKIGNEVVAIRRSFSESDVYGTIYDVMTFEDFATQTTKYDYAIKVNGDDGVIAYARECDIRLHVSDSFKGTIDELSGL